MTEQEAYERMRAWLGREGASKSENSAGLCVYRKGDGNKCAVGALIPDEEYDEDFERQEIEDVVNACPSLDGLDVVFLRYAQGAHDNVTWQEANFSAAAVTRLDEVALEYGLEVVSP